MDSGVFILGKLLLEYRTKYLHKGDCLIQVRKEELGENVNLQWSISSPGDPWTNFVLFIECLKTLYFTSLD